MKLSIDIARHIFCIIVIFRHMASQSRYSPETNEWLAGINYAIEGGIVGFFLLAGTLLRYQTNLPQYIKHQATRLLVPFFLFSLIYAIGLSSAGKMEFTDGLIRTVTLSGSSMQLYSLPYICGLTILYSSIDRVWNLQINSKILLALILTVCVLLLHTKRATGPDYRLLPFYALALVWGSILRDLHISAKSFIQYSGLVALIISFMFVLSLADHRFFVLGRVSSIFLLAHIISRHMTDRRLPGTGAVYLLHTPFVNAIISILLLQLAVTEKWNIVITVPLTYLTCLGIYYLVDRYFGRFRWLLLGPVEPSAAVAVPTPQAMTRAAAAPHLAPGDRKRA